MSYNENNGLGLTYYTLNLIREQLSAVTKILSVDDDPTIRAMIVDILETQDYEIVSAIDGRAGIEAAKNHLPDLIICDVEMPDMNGWGMLEEVRKTQELREIPFIFLTGLNSMKNLRQGMNLGADDYLTKPFTYEELIKAVQTRLERHQMLKEKHQEELERADKRIAQATYFDSTTGLPNRKLMQEHFLTTVNAANGQNVSVISMCLDHFEETMASRPQAFSNLILKQTAQRLKKIFTTEEGLIYFEHNHFLGFSPTDSERIGAQNCLQKIQLSLSEPFLIMQNSLYLTASIGIAIYPIDAQEPGLIVQYAIESRKKALVQGGNQFFYYG